MSFVAATVALVSLAASAADPQGARRWAHELVTLDGVDDFFGAGSSSAYRARLEPAAPLRLSVGPQDPDPHADVRWREEVAGRFDRSPTADELSSWYVSPPLTSPAGFQQLLLSWNVDCPAESGVCFELRVRASEDGAWTPWLYVGDWGASLPAPRTIAAARADHLVASDEPQLVASDGARIDIDYLVGKRTWRAAQFRVRATGSGPQLNRSVIVRRVALCFSRKTDEPAPAFAPPDDALRLHVPFRSQKSERAEIAGRICSPTSVAMALAHRGLEVETLAVAERAYDSAHDIYGNWTRAIQAAYSFGAPGRLARFSDWNEVARHIAQGTPLVISIAAEEGELDGAPYSKTAGHLLVLCGFDAKGDVHVNDPAAATAETGRLVYRREQLEKVWMGRGGTAYVILAPR